MIIVDPSAGSIPTRSDLLEAVKEWDNQPGWQRFYATYARLIHGVARSQGLSDSEAQEVVQDTMLSVAKTMPDFQYDPARCSFKTWLRHLTRKRVVDLIRKRRRGVTLSHGGSRDGGSTDVLERVADTRRSDLDVIWDREWHSTLVECALQHLKPQVTAMQFQVFFLHVVKENPARQVARVLKVNLGFVYLVKHRLTPKFKRWVSVLQGQLGEGSTPRKF